MYILYADESGSTGMDYDNEQQPIFILGGFLIKDDIWHETNKIFNQMKIEINPIFKDVEIHTNEIFNSSKKSVFDKFDWRTNLKILEELADLICSLDLEFFFVGVDKPKFKTNMLNNKSFNGSSLLEMDPYMISYIKLQYLISEYIDSKGNENGLIFLDEFVSLDEEIPIMSQIVSEMEDSKENIIEKALFLKSDSSNFVQIADFYAFYLNKFFMITKGYKKYSDEKTKHCIRICEKLIAHTNEKNCILYEKL